jgi:flagellar hook assembly protein FlgD
MDVHGNAVGWQDGGPFSIMPGGQEELAFAWDGKLDEGAYTLALTQWRDGQAAGRATSQVNVVGGAITHLQVPTTTVMPGKQSAFKVSFANYQAGPVTATARLAIYDRDGLLVQELGVQSSQASGGSEITFTFTWQPSGVPGGEYTAWAQVKKEDEVTYGPAIETFQVGYSLYLPRVLRQ